MLHFLAPFLEPFFGPFRLLGSHVLLAAGGATSAALAVAWFLPKTWGRLPHDHGKALVAGGQASRGKPTGAGLFVTLLALPSILLFMPFTIWDFGALVCLYASMAFGYLDDASDEPWGQLRKGLLDAVVCGGVAVFVFLAYAHGTGDWFHVRTWFPFVKGHWDVPWWLYLPAASAMLWFSLNATNCSDGVDGLAGTLTAVTLLVLAGFLYAVIGNMQTAEYFAIPVGGTAARAAARWAVLLVTVAGALAGYLWWNAEPSRVLMGDAGSRFLGLLVGAGALVSGNLFLVLAFAPVVLVNGGTGLFKIACLRAFGKLGWDVRPTSSLAPEEAARQKAVVRLLHSVRFPLHDHCKRAHGWSNAQVLMRFALLQAFLTPLLFVVLVKMR